MFKVILFLLAGAVVVACAWFLAGIPGHIVASVGAFTVETSPAIGMLGLIILMVAAVLLLRIGQLLVGIPGLGLTWRRRHRVTMGERAVTRTLVALAAGEQGTARKEGRRARELLGDSAQTLMLVAEAARMSGRQDEAEAAFQALTKQRDARFLGYRGLLRQAVDRQDWPGALTIAKQAEAVHPGAVWLRAQRAELALQAENWVEALEWSGSDPRRCTYYVAAAAAETDPVRALSYAKQGWKEDPGFPPAVLSYASRLRAAGQEKRAQSCILDAWSRNPHPDLAAFALAPLSDKLARAQAAKRLVGGNPTHPESRLLLAQVALDAGLTGEARHQLDLAANDGLRQRRLCLLRAEIEEQDRGDTEAGRLAQRDALRSAATAAPDPHWQCSNCYVDHAIWRPKCPACGTVGAIKWVDTGMKTGLSVVAVGSQD